MAKEELQKFMGYGRLKVNTAYETVILYLLAYICPFYLHL